jgi:hypothetical protein
MEAKKGGKKSPKVARKSRIAGIFREKWADSGKFASLQFRLPNFVNNRFHGSFAILPL